MKTYGLNRLLMSAVMLLYASAGYAHTSGQHSGGLLQQLMHILHSPDHLFIILALLVVAGLLMRQSRKHRD